MEAGNKKLYAKDLTPIALTTQHKRGIIGAYVEGKVKVFDKQKSDNTNSQKTASQSSRGGGRGRGDRGGARGRGDRGRGERGRGSGRGRGGQGSQKNEAKPDNKQSRDAQKVARGEPLPTKSKKKLVDRIKDPHVQAMIRDQLEKGLVVKIMASFSNHTF